MQLLTNHFRKLSKKKVQLLQTISEKFFLSSGAVIINWNSLKKNLQLLINYFEKRFKDKEKSN